MTADARDEHRERREHERCARGSAPTPTRIADAPHGEQDRDDRDHRLGECRADGGQDGADRALGQLELVTEPLDAVREQLGADAGSPRSATEQDRDVHLAPICTPRGSADADAMTTRSRSNGAIRRLAPAQEPTPDDDHPADRRAHDGQEAESTGSRPAPGPPVGARWSPRSSGGARSSGDDAVREHQHHADRKQRDRRRRSHDEQPAGGPLRADPLSARRRRASAAASCEARWAIWNAVYSSTTTNSKRRKRTSIAMGDPRADVAPDEDADAVGPATYGSMPPRMR